MRALTGPTAILNSSPGNSVSPNAKEQEDDLA